MIFVALPFLANVRSMHSEVFRTTVVGERFPWKPEP